MRIGSLIWGRKAAKKADAMVAQGTPETVARVKKSYTGQALAGYFGSERKYPVASTEYRVKTS